MIQRDLYHIFIRRCIRQPVNSNLHMNLLVWFVCKNKEKHLQMCKYPYKYQKHMNYSRASGKIRSSNIRWLINFCVPSCWLGMLSVCFWNSSTRLQLWFSLFILKGYEYEVMLMLGEMRKRRDIWTTAVYQITTKRWNSKMQQIVFRFGLKVVDQIWSVPWCFLF